MIAISVIIPTYKPDNYIFECLDSLKKQTLSSQEFEIVVVLNGCKSPYEDVLRTYIQKELNRINIKLIQVDIAGVSNARNVGLECIIGNYVCFIDDDDIVSPTYLSCLLSLASNDTIVVSNVYTFIDNIYSVGEDYLTKSFRRYVGSKTMGIFRLRSFMSSACCKLIPMNIIQDRRFDTHFKTGEDSLFMAGISDKIAHIKLLQDQSVVYYRRIRPNSASRVKRVFSARLKNCLLLLAAYWRIFWTCPLHFDVCFFISRGVATVISVFR